MHRAFITSNKKIIMGKRKAPSKKVSKNSSKTPQKKGIINWIRENKFKIIYTFKIIEYVYELTKDN
jgi:hypothetical protein